jgi:hypothetical protein
VFIGAVSVFHLILVYSPLKLEKNSWKKVDYIWLTMSVISIVGIISQGRQILASNWIPIAEQQIMYRTNYVNQALGLFIDKGQNCNYQFVIGAESAPNTPETNKQMLQFCYAMAKLRKSLEPLLKRSQSISLDIIQIPEYPLAIDFAYERDFIKEQVDSYNKSVQTLASLREAAGHSAAEIGLLMISPFLLAVALALRMTKVSAELRQD